MSLPRRSIRDGGEQRILQFVFLILQVVRFTGERRVIVRYSVLELIEELRELTRAGK